MPEPFQIKDCALSVIATGEHAGSMFELRDKLSTIAESSIYYHFWGGRLRPTFVHPEYHNDFARWADQTLGDRVLAERLSVLDPMQHPNAEALRSAVLDVIDGRLDELEQIYWSRRENNFHFIRSIVIVFSTPTHLVEPAQLEEVIPKISGSSIFYHFIDARRRTEKRIDDFTLWLSSFDSAYTDLIQQIQAIDPYFSTLTEIRRKLSEIIHVHFHQ